MLLRKCRRVNLLIPTLQKSGQPDGVAYEGATVIEVRRRERCALRHGSGLTR